MSLQRKWYITFMQTDSSRSVCLSVNKNIGHLLVLFFILIVIAFASGAFYVWKKNSDLAELSKLQKENTLLRERLTHFSTQMDSILIKIRIMENWEDDLREDKKLKIINPDIRALGSGGEPFIDPTFIAFDAGLHNLYNHNVNRLSYVMSKISLTYETHFDLITLLQTRESLFNSTPSIMPTFGKVTDRYGYRIHPVFRYKTFHAGIDIANDKGTPIYATADGTVSFASKSGLSGNLVRIEHSSGYQTRYAHLDDIFVKAGDFVQKGQIIASMGNSGNSTGNHLHYEVFELKRGATVDPRRHFNVKEEDITIAQSGF